MMSRVQRWRDKPWRLGVIHRHEDDNDALQEAWQQRVSNPKRARGEDGFSTSYLTKISKEIIYCRDGEVDGCPTLLYMTWGLDFGSAEMTLDANWIANPSRDERTRSGPRSGQE